jgi:hypothetical protein
MEMNLKKRKVTISCIYLGGTCGYNTNGGLVGHYRGTLWLGHGWSM